MKYIHAVYVNNEDGMVELELFSNKEQALLFQQEMDKLYDCGVGYWLRPIDIISPLNRLLHKNPVTGFEPSIGKDANTGEYTSLPYDSDFWK